MIGSTVRINVPTSANHNRIGIIVSSTNGDAEYEQWDWFVEFHKDDYYTTAFRTNELEILSKKDIRMFI